MCDLRDVGDTGFAFEVSARFPPPFRPRGPRHPGRWRSSGSCTTVGRGQQQLASAHIGVATSSSSSSSARRRHPHSASTHSDIGRSAGSWPHHDADARALLRPEGRAHSSAPRSRYLGISPSCALRSSPGPTTSRMALSRPWCGRHGRPSAPKRHRRLGQRLRSPPRTETAAWMVSPWFMPCAPRIRDRAPRSPPDRAWACTRRKTTSRRGGVVR